MQVRTPLLLITLLAVAGLLSACGGGGGGGGDVASPPPPPPEGYAGTYTCAGGPETMTAVLKATSGDFSSCSGIVHGTTAFSCTGSISEAGAFSAVSTDQGITVTRTGTVEGNQMVGTIFISADGSTNDYRCTRS